MSSSSSRKTDEQIQQLVLDQLRWDMRIDPAEIDVEVHGGVVTLSGTVSSWDRWIAAEEAAHRACAERESVPVTPGFVTVKSDKDAERHPGARSGGGVRSVVNLIDVRRAEPRLRRSSRQ